MFAAVQFEHVPPIAPHELLLIAVHSPTTQVVPQKTGQHPLHAYGTPHPTPLTHCRVRRLHAEPGGHSAAPVQAMHVPALHVGVGLTHAAHVLPRDPQAPFETPVTH